MLTADFDFTLPPERIAQHPAQPRDSARLLHVAPSGLHDRIVRDLPAILSPGDLLVANDTRVIPAQLTARRGAATIGLTLDRPDAHGDWHALARNARRLHPGDVLDCGAGLQATVIAGPEHGEVTLRFNVEGDDFARALHQAGALALPPYIARPEGLTPADASDYQTIFAAHPGAVAAPTAGLHFTPELLARLAHAGISRATVTLHVGAGTFLPMRTEIVAEHRMHAERGEITTATAAAINETRQAGGRILAVGTTTLRLLETAARPDGTIAPFAGETAIFITPGTPIRGADLLLTNFHLPRSTLFMLVCAFAGIERMKAAYAHAIETGYRFYSYGDATLLERSDRLETPRA